VTVTYSLAPNPKWYIADLVGRPLGAGYMFTYSSLNKTVEKFVYQDAAGVFPWPDPVRFDENGSQGPFYWKFDSSNPLDLYYIEIYDVNMVLQWTIDNFDGTGGGGGGGTTTVLDITNLVPNNIFWRGVNSPSPIGSTYLEIAPGNHVGLANTNSQYGPDIFFKKSNINCTDTFSLSPFSVGSNALTGDVTPQQYLNYTCTATGAAGETYKYVQIPICKGVQNLQNISIKVTVWARVNSGSSNLVVNLAQFFGDGSAASPTVTTTLQTLTLTSSWTQYTITTTIPTISTKVIGACGNDGLFLQFQYPLNAATNIDFIKPCIYLGTIAPTIQFSSIDAIESLVNSERTGHIIAGYDGSAPYGYLFMDDRTIGSSSSGATSNPAAGGINLGASISTFPLYNLLWDNVSSPSSNVLCPVTGGLGASAAADFEANKTMFLPAGLGRVLSNSGQGAFLTNRILGSFTGAETTNQVPNHTHTFHTNQGFVQAGGAQTELQGGGGFGVTNSVVGSGTTDNNAGGVSSINLLQPTSFTYFFIKL
jgi:hypothetical protein